MIHVPMMLFCFADVWLCCRGEVVLSVRLALEQERHEVLRGLQQRELKRQQLRQQQGARNGAPAEDGEAAGPGPQDAALGHVLVRFEVRDCGGGLAAEDAAHISRLLKVAQGQVWALTDQL